MPFIVQGKTNWKSLLIVAVLSFIAGGGILWWQGQQEIELIQPDQFVGQAIEDGSFRTVNIFFTTNKTEYLPWEVVYFVYTSDFITFSDANVSKNMRRQVYLEETGKWEYIDEDLRNDIDCQKTYNKGSTFDSWHFYKWKEIGAWHEKEKIKTPKFRIVYYYSEEKNCEEIKSAYSNEFTVRTPKLGEETDDYFRSCVQESQKIKDDCQLLEEEGSSPYFTYSGFEECFNKLSQKEKDLCLLVPVSSAAFDEQYLYYCDNISDSLFGDYCYKKAAILSGKITICNKIEDKNVKENCYARLEGKKEPFPDRKCTKDDDCLLNNCNSCVNKEDKTPFICVITRIVWFVFQTTENEYMPYSGDTPGLVPFGNDTIANSNMFMQDVCNYLNCFSSPAYSIDEINSFIPEKKCFCIDNICQQEEEGV